MTNYVSYEKAKKVMEKYVEKWMKIPGVHGVGITKRGNNHYIIISYSPGHGTLSQIPNEVDGVKIIKRIEDLAKALKKKGK